MANKVPLKGLCLLFLLALAGIACVLGKDTTDKKDSDYTDYDSYEDEDYEYYDDDYTDSYDDAYFDLVGNSTKLVGLNKTSVPAPTKKAGSKSSIVAFAPAADLINGNDDISLQGNCTAEIKQYCKDVEAGGAQLADCLQQQLDIDETDDKTPDTISKKCKSELLDFKVLRDTNINLNTNLATKCKVDADKYCNVTWFWGYKSGQVVVCLRDRKEKLTGPCKKEVFKIQLDAAYDYRADSVLYEACQEDAGKVCKDVEAGGGRIQSCLRDNRMKLSWKCEEELFRQEMEDADDIRLSVRLFRKCLKDKQKFCSDVPPGNAMAKECLEEHREDEGFTQGCRDEIDAMIARRVRDFRLDTRLQKVCEKDILNMCAWFEDLDSMDKDDAAVVRCLQDYAREIKNPACRKRVRRYKRLSAQDIRFNVPLADYCFEDRQKYCANVPPGSARVIRCLEANRQQLSVNCRATLFDEEQRFSENIDFQYPMKQACLKEIDSYCKDIPHGNGRVIRCLQDKKKEPEFGKECKKEVEKFEQNSSSDYRLNFRLKNACQKDIKALCKDACKVQDGQICAGRMLRCLTDKRDEIKSKECKKEVTYFQKMEVTDYRNDVILAEACRPDVQKLCNSVEPGADAAQSEGHQVHYDLTELYARCRRNAVFVHGSLDALETCAVMVTSEGRIHQCLRKNRAKLSEQCRKEELLLETQENDSIELKVGLLKACNKERALYCKDVDAGSGRVFRCLAENMGDADFGGLCATEVMTKLRRRQNNWKLDPALRKACRPDVNQFCAQEDSKNAEDGSVYKCLIARVQDIAPGCAKEAGRAVHMAFFTWMPDALLTAPCDADIKTFCLKDRPNMDQKPGAVSQCIAEIVESNFKFLGDRRRLQKASGFTTVKQLSDKCLQLAAAAQPPDMKEVFEVSLSVALLHNQLQTLEHVTGAQMMQRDIRGNAHALTLTGWTAMSGIAAMCVLIVYGAIYSYRRYYGLDKKDYTLVVKKDKRGGSWF